MSDNDYVGYKIKIFPNKYQQQIFKEYFGLSRYVYNLGINIQEEYYKETKDDENVQFKVLSFHQLGVKLVQLKKTKKYSWLSEYDAYSVKNVLKDVRNSYKRFFKGITNHPRYKVKKNYHQMFHVRADRLEITANYIRLPSIGNIDCKNHGYTECIGIGDKNNKSKKYRHYCNSRVIYDGCDYWLTFEMEVSHEDSIEANSCKRFKNNEIWQHKDYSEPIGIDLGCKKNNWIVDSRGNRIERPDTSKEERQVKKYQAIFNRKYRINRNLGKKANSTIAKNAKRGQKEYTKNEEKILKKLNKAYKRINNKKKNIIHEYTCSIIQEKPSKVILEDIYVSSMYYSESDDISYKHRKNHNRNIRESMLRTVRTIIENKCYHNNIPVLIADREYPSSQLCSKCGYRQKIGTLRTYKCPCCGNEIDRDFNAALNLSYLGYPEYNYNYA